MEGDHWAFRPISVAWDLQPPAAVGCVMRKAMWSWAALVLAGCVVVTGCAGAESAPGSDPKGPGGKADDGTPDGGTDGDVDGGEGPALSLVFLNDATGEITRYDGATRTATPEATLPGATVAYQLAGDVYAELGGDAPSVGKLVNGVFTPLSEGMGAPLPASRLLGAAVVEGVPNLLLGLELEGDDADSSDLVAYNTSNQTHARVGYASAPEYGVTRASYGGGKYAFCATADLSELISYADAAGTDLEGVPSPTDNLPYNAAPYVQQAVISPDGTRIAYLEGPETTWNNEGLPTVQGEWAFVLFEVATGTQLARIGLPDWGVEAFPLLDFDGRYVVVSLGAKGSPVLIDTATPTPTMTSLTADMVFVTFAR